MLNTGTSEDKLEETHSIEVLDHHALFYPPGIKVETIDDER